MHAEIRPEPTPAEREALGAALREAGEEEPPPSTSAWRAAGLELEDDYEATTRPRNRRGATRA